MKQTQHRVIALCLAFLVLISTTGISMNIMLCQCTGEQYLALLANDTPRECCQKHRAQATKKQCCSKATSKQCSIDNKQTHFKAKKNCCTPGFQYAKANINFELQKHVDFVINSFFTVIPVIKSVTYDYCYSNPFVGLETTKRLHNKAPPQFFGQLLLHWIQTYRC